MKFRSDEREDKHLFEQSAAPVTAPRRYLRRTKKRRSSGGDKMTFVEWLQLGTFRKRGFQVTAIVLCFLFLFGILTPLLPKKKFSENENRVLADAPKLRLADVADGSFQSAYATYFSDHFAGRNGWISIQRRFQRTMGQRSVNGVYIGRKGHLFLIPTKPEKKNTASLIKAINAFAAANPDLNHYTAIAPNAVSVQSEYLPKHAVAPDQKQQLAQFAEKLDQVNAIDLFTPLRKHASEEIYYRTDHHWTSLGAKYAFEEISIEMALDTEKTTFSTVTVSENFLGTLASKCGVQNHPDSIQIYVPKTDVVYLVQFDSVGEKSGTMFHRDALTGKDQYAVFFGGNYGCVEIRTSSVTGRRLLVFKDSYANALMQFMIPFFDEIVMIDPRYFYDDLQPILNQHAITDVMYLYNADTFFSDTSLADVLTAETEDAADKK